MDDRTNREKPETKVLRAQDIIPSSEAEPEDDNSSAVPQFDLADEIMAQHRKTTAGRRKGPGVKTPANREKAKTKPQDVPARFPAFEAAPPDSVIAEIVARDIRRMLQLPSNL